MKIAGAMLIIITAYMIGRIKRGSALVGERVLDQIIQLFKEIKSSIEHSVGSLVNTITTSSCKEVYNKLGFLAKVAVDQKTGLYLGEVLCRAFDSWEYAASLTKDERAIITGVFNVIGSDSGKSEVTKLDFAVERLEELHKARRENNKKHKGYYETVFTLAGIAAAILLI